MVGYIVIFAIGLWICIKTGSFWAVIGSLAALGIYAVIRKAIQMVRSYNE